MDLPGLLAGPDQGDDVLGEKVGMHREAIAEFVAAEDMMRDVRNRSAITRRFEACGHEFQTFDRGNIAFQAASDAAEEGDGLVQIGLRARRTIDRLVQPDDIADQRGFVGGFASAQDRLRVVIRIHDDLGGFGGIDIREDDFFEHVRKAVCAPFIMRTMPGAKR